MTNVWDQLLVAFVGALPALVVALWAWFKAHAASTSEKWDDDVVQAIEKIASGVGEAAKK
jgi:hypothetical protein